MRHTKYAVSLFHLAYAMRNRWAFQALPTLKGGQTAKLATDMKSMGVMPCVGYTFSQGLIKGTTMGFITPY